jgi:hypothetical protein|tara:strand:- start:139 stop:621 length:483 start_codon:yes stop_codon:yes gene_type:complete
MEMTLPTWNYQGRMVTEISDMPDGTYGFIYETKHIPSGIKYIGKKVLFFERNKRLGKRALETLRLERKEKGIGGRTPAKQKIITESDWKDYYGSHKDILKLVKEGTPQDFSRTILQFVSSKKLLTYYECKYLFINEALETQGIYINDNVLGKFYRKDFKE